MAGIHLVPLEQLELRFAPKTWPFAAGRRAEIDRHFAEMRRGKPEMWNGRVLVLHEFAITDGVLRGAYLETDFASFLAWRDWGYPDQSVRNCFAMGAVRASDGAFVLGIMGDHTANAGKIYFFGDPEPGWRAIFDGGRIAIVKVLRAVEPAAALRARILAFLSREQTPELAGVHMVRERADFDARMPPFVPKFFDHIWAAAPDRRPAAAHR